MTQEPAEQLVGPTARVVSDIANASVAYPPNVHFIGTYAQCIERAEAIAESKDGAIVTVQCEGREDLHFQADGEQIHSLEGYGRGWYDFPDFRESGYGY